MKKHLRILGMYISLIAIAHFGLYILLNVFSESLGYLFYFDTNIGLFLIETVVKHSEGTSPALSAWFVEIAALALGIGMMLGKSPLLTYILLEGFLTIIYLLFFLLIAAAGLSANHGFSPAELLIPSIVVILGCLLPLTYAIWIRVHFRSAKNLSIT